MAIAAFIVWPSRRQVQLGTLKKRACCFSSLGLDVRVISVCWVPVAFTELDSCTVQQLRTDVYSLADYEN